MSIKIIAEAGVNHNGDLGLALNLVDEAKKAGADYVKFQCFRAEDVATLNAEKAAYQNLNTGIVESQRNMLSKLELSDSCFESIHKKCIDLGIGFLASGFCPDDFRFLKRFEMDYLKIPSGEITNLPLLQEISDQSSLSKVILSTGMSGLSDVEDALSVLINNNVARDQITLLHCTTEYPAPFESVNLSAMNTLKEAFHCDVGYSDHTEGIHVGIAAAALGATILEKHFTLDKSMPGPDHKASLNPKEFKLMVKNIREINQSLGDGIKRISLSEKDNILIARKSLVALKPIKAGEVFTAENLGCKRPGLGISPMRYYDYIGKQSQTDYNKDDLIL